MPITAKDLSVVNVEKEEADMPRTVITAAHPTSVSPPPPSQPTDTATPLPLKPEAETPHATSPHQQIDHAVPILRLARRTSDADDEPALPDAASKEYKAKITISVKDRTKSMNTLAEIPSRVTHELASMDNYYVSISDPRDSSVRGVKRPSLFLVPYLIIRKLYTQAIAAVLYAISVIMTLVQCFGGGGATNWFSFFVTLLFLLEMSVLWLFESVNFRLALRDKYWRVAEPAFLLVGFALEIAAWATYNAHGRCYGLTTLAWLRLIFYWIPHGKTRWEQLQYGVRTLCSADRRRYMGEAYDLDYAYVHRSLAAMGWPAYNYERLFRNAMEDVVGFLDRKHPNAYLVVNLCSERTYSPSYFHNQTSWYPMDDHNPAELEMLLAFSREAADFIAEDPNSRVVVVHCKGGKGRTGTLCCAYLMFTGLKRNADDALQHFSLLRTKDGASAFQGVQAPSQERYVRYFEKLLKQPNLIPPDRSLRVTGLRLNNIPWLWYTQGVGKLWFVIVGKPCTDRTVIFQSNEKVEFNSSVPDPATYTKKQFRDLFGSDEDNLYKECNEMDPSLMNRGNDNGDVTASGSLSHCLDTTSFWFYVNGDRSRRYSYADFYAKYGNNFVATKPSAADIERQKQLSASNDGDNTVHSVSLEFKEPQSIPVLSGDVVFKFYFARNNPNPLEPPVQFWLHPSFENDETITLDRDKLDGPPKDKKAERYPVDFAIELDADYLVPDRE